MCTDRFIIKNEYQDESFIDPYKLQYDTGDFEDFEKELDSYISDEEKELDLQDEVITDDDENEILNSNQIIRKTKVSDNSSVTSVTKTCYSSVLDSDLEVQIPSLRRGRPPSGHFYNVHNGK
jgi:hypothetical protein